MNSINWQLEKDKMALEKKKKGNWVQSTGRIEIKRRLMHILKACSIKCKAEVDRDKKEKRISLLT